MSKELFFIFKEEDLIEFLNFIESSYKIKYIKAGLLNKVPILEYSLLLKSNLGFVNHKDWNFNETYLILDIEHEPTIRKVPQRDGGVKYAIDQLDNSNSIVISLGGYNINENAIIASKVTSIHNTKFCKSFFKQVNKFMRANCIKSDRFYIGKDTLKMTSQGIRLTEDTRSPKEYDIKPFK